MKEDNSLDAVKEVFTQFLVERKHRKTPERYAILEHIFSHEGHFNAELLYNAMQKEYRVSLATVYNTLELLLECRLIVKHQFGEQLLGAFFVGFDIHPLVDVIPEHPDLTPEHPAVHVGFFIEFIMVFDQFQIHVGEIQVHQFTLAAIQVIVSAHP